MIYGFLLMITGDPHDLMEIISADADRLENNNRTFWTNKLDNSGLQASLSPVVRHLFDLYRIDWAAKMTLETIWAYFMEGGFRHDTAWYCYGPYLTLQLAHAFLLTGDVEKMDKCLAWAVNAGYAEISRYEGESSDRWQVVSGAWNEQHCYPAAKDFSEVPQRWWYMGDIPHGWACAEYLLLLRDILFFEADEDNEPHIYIAPGVMPHWLGDGKSISVSDAPTVFGSLFGYKLTHNQAAKSVEIQILQPPPSHVSFIYPCRFGSGVSSVTADGSSLAITGNDVKLPANTTQATVRYL